MSKPKSFVQNVELSSKCPELRLDWCSEQAARFAVEKWHYSKSLPAPPHVRVGVWEDAKFVGCILFSRGATQNLCRPYKLKITEVCELTRVALKSHMHMVSRMVAIALKFLKRHCPQLKLCISFADPRQGHIGAIYQAGNWIYAGQTSPSKGYIGPDGKLWHERMISVSGKKKCFGVYRRVFRPDQCKVIKMPGKYRYLMPLDTSIRERIEALRQAYPKRVRSETVDTAGNPPAKGRSTRTRTLQV